MSAQPRERCMHFQRDDLISDIGSSGSQFCSHLYFCLLTMSQINGTKLSSLLLHILRAFEKYNWIWMLLEELLAKALMSSLVPLGVSESFSRWKTLEVSVLGTHLLVSMGTPALFFSLSRTLITFVLPSTSNCVTNGPKQWAQSITNWNLKV